MRLPGLCLICVVAVGVAATFALSAGEAPPAPTVSTIRKEMAPYIKAAHEALRQGDFAEARDQLAKAEDVPGRTDYEQHVMDQLRMMEVNKKQIKPSFVRPGH